MGGASGRKCCGCVWLSRVVALLLSLCQAATTNSKSALSASNKKTTLPADFQFPPETLSQLSLKPSVCVSVPPARRRPLLAAGVPLPLHWCAALTPLLSDVQLRQEAQKRLSGEMGEGIGDYDYNNANDTANFCPALEVTPPGCSPVGFW